MVNAALLVDLLKDIFLTLLLGENNKPRLEYSTIEKYQSTLTGAFIICFFTLCPFSSIFRFFLNKLSF
jgi:hypothetical protein